MLARSGLVGKKSSRPYLGPSEAIFSIGRKNPKNAKILPIFLVDPAFLCFLLIGSIVLPQFALLCIALPCSAEPMTKDQELMTNNQHPNEPRTRRTRRTKENRHFFFFAIFDFFGPRKKRASDGSE